MVSLHPHSETCTIRSNFFDGAQSGLLDNFGERDNLLPELPQLAGR